MSDRSRDQISVGPTYGLSTFVKLSSRVRELCPFLRSLPPNCSLPAVFIMPFRIVLAYLDGDLALNSFTEYNRDISLLLLFASTWVLAARLGLPALQNSLLAAMTSIYDETLRSREHYPVDEDLDQAFCHVRKEVGTNSHAEKFLICFVGRTTSLTSELEKRINRHIFDEEISGQLLAEARSFSPDPIKHASKRFRVDAFNPPYYRPLEIQHAQPSSDQFGALPKLTLQELQNLGRFAAEKRGTRSCSGSVVSFPLAASRNSFAAAKHDFYGQAQACLCRASSSTIVAKTPVTPDVVAPAEDPERTSQQREATSPAVPPRVILEPIVVQSPANGASRDSIPDVKPEAPSAAHERLCRRRDAEAAYKLEGSKGIILTFSYFVVVLSSLSILTIRAIVEALVLLSYSRVIANSTNKLYYNSYLVKIIAFYKLALSLLRLL
ncbi:hypothetical protein BDU57DRAFT_569476 [Ampelomyces quisqualis]|uniref:Uncharacterized protein n=1 Tax=Ampelomyces quisqualis TaxID=50730 RepID=A0A6A5R0S4_AMPQU|nr:hypothetical protein BDU57DRAFT_569476 [Ampelomyces quisqualis]